MCHMPPMYTFTGTGSSLQSFLAYMSGSTEERVLTGIQALTGVGQRARPRAGLLQAAILIPMSGGVGAGADASSGASTGTSSSAAKPTEDKRERRLAVLGPVSLVCVDVVTVAAVWVGCIAVGLDVSSIRALEAGRPRSELRKA
jgi:hypothetical protein